MLVRADIDQTLVLSWVLDILTHSIDEGRIAFATVELGERAVTLGRHAPPLAAA